MADGAQSSRKKRGKQGKPRATGCCDMARVMERGLEVVPTAWLQNSMRADQQSAKSPRRRGGGTGTEPGPAVWPELLSDYFYQVSISGAPQAPSQADRDQMIIARGTQGP